MKSSKRSASAAIIGGNEDLLIAIFLLLPAKSLAKFKAVCKMWLSLISSPLFCRRHLETQNAFIFHSRYSRGSRFHVCNLTVPRFFTFEFDFKFSEVEILQSCNGLLLLRCRNSFGGSYRYFVFNPTTLKQRNLSRLPTASVFVAGIYLMFDPAKSPYYRVVCFEYIKSKFICVHLYDSETHEWKRGGERIARDTNFHDGIYLNGGIYFLRCSSSSYRFTPDDGLTKIPCLPRLPGRRMISHGKRWNCAIESNGVPLVFSGHETNVLVVYEMKEMESGWAKKYEVDMNPISEIDSVDLHYVIMGEKEEDSLLLFSVPQKLMIYRFHAATFEVLADFTTFHRDKEGPSSFGNARRFIQTHAPV